MKHKIRSLLILIVIVGAAYFAYTQIFNKKEEPPKFIYHDILNKIGENSVDVDTFTIYGKYLNLKGTLPSEGEYELVLKNNEE